MGNPISVQNQSQKPDGLKQLDERVSIAEVLPFAIQQILTMFVSNVVPIGLVASAALPSLAEKDVLILVQNAMIAAGLATFLQVSPIFGIGSGLPIFMGVSFTFVVPLTAIAAKHGYGTVVGAVLAGGIFEGILGLSARYWKRLIPPIVSGTVVTGIGISLLPVAARSFGGGYSAEFGSLGNIITGCITLFTCILWQIHAKGILKQLSVLAGLAAGFLLSLVLGNVDLSHLFESGFFAFPKLLPCMPQFRFDAILSICIIYLVSAAETIGDASALVSGALKRDITPKEVSGSLQADGFGSMLAGLFGVTPVTSYSQNIGITIMTGVINRTVAKAGVLIMILCGLVPPIGAFLTSIPSSVLGGVMLVIMGQIVVSGFEMIAKAGFTPRNKLITALSLAFGIGFTASSEAGIWVSFPIAIQSIFAQNIVSVIFVSAFVLNLILPEIIED